MKLGNKIKNWGDPSTLSFHNCPICVEQGVETIKIQKKDKEKWWLKSKNYNYHDPKCFGYGTILFDSIKHLGSVVIK